ncbi:MAG TPA: DUF4290 domain-containing protein [Cyclobacteriaceae bacterium]|nr:DUF4290 domain-containing protein [Cyclobacteriaceae bacterium]
MGHNIGFYNTQKEAVILKEYGRNIQMLAKYLNTIDDKEKRSQTAKALIELMKQINPAVRDITEDSQKLWDDLFIMSDFTLEIDSPFPKPEKSILNRKPEYVTYRDKEITYKHYGLNIQLLVEKTVTIENEEDREAAIIYIGRLIKSFSSIWNKENLDDDSVMENITHLSGGKLKIDMNKVKEQNLFDSLVKEKPRGAGSNGQHREQHGNQHGIQHGSQHGQQRHHRKGKRKRM